MNKQLALVLALASTSALGATAHAAINDPSGGGGGGGGPTPGGGNTCAKTLDEKKVFNFDTGPNMPGGIGTSSFATKAWSAGVGLSTGVEADCDSLALVAAVDLHGVLFGGITVKPAEASVSFGTNKNGTNGAKLTVRGFGITLYDQPLLTSTAPLSISEDASYELPESKFSGSWSYTDDDFIPVIGGSFKASFSYKTEASTAMWLTGHIKPDDVSGGLFAGATVISSAKAQVSYKRKWTGVPILGEVSVNLGFEVAGIATPISGIVNTNAALKPTTTPGVWTAEAKLVSYLHHVIEGSLKARIQYDLPSALNTWAGIGDIDKTVTFFSFPGYAFDDVWEVEKTFGKAF